MERRKITEWSKDRRLSRREFMKVAGAGTAAATTPGSFALAARAEQTTQFDAEYDVVVCGGGCGGLATALFARWHGNSVLILEKAASLGGTAVKAAFWYWVPNNEPLRKLGIQDSKQDFLKYVARVTAPQTFDPDAPTLGMNDWQYTMCEAIYESAAPAVELLAQKGALPYRHVPWAVDYWAELPEDKTPRGRVLVPKEAKESLSDGGRVAVRTMTGALRRDGVAIRTSHRVRRVLLNNRGEAIGLEALRGTGEVY